MVPALHLRSGLQRHALDACEVEAFHSATAVMKLANCVAVPQPVRRSQFDTHDCATGWFCGRNCAATEPRRAYPILGPSIDLSMCRAAVRPGGRPSKPRGTAERRSFPG